MQRTTRTTSPINRTTITQSAEMRHHTEHTNKRIVACRKCKSTQIVANKRGYSFAKLFLTLGIMILASIVLLALSSSLMFYSSVRSSFISSAVGFFGVIGFIGLVLALPVSILVGFIGRSEIVNGCMNCGFKWTPAKKK